MCKRNYKTFTFLTPTVVIMHQPVLTSYCLLKHMCSKVMYKLEYDTVDFQVY